MVFGSESVEEGGDTHQGKGGATSGAQQHGTWEEARNRLNQILRGWSAYFSYGTRVAAHDAVDRYVYESVRHFLRRRHQVHSRGTNRFSIEAVFGELGVLRLSRARVQTRS